MAEHDGTPRIGGPMITIYHCYFSMGYWLVVSTPFKNISQMGCIVPNIWKVIKFHGSKAPTRSSFTLPIDCWGKRKPYIHRPPTGKYSWNINGKNVPNHQPGICITHIALGGFSAPWHSCFQNPTRTTAGPSHELNVIR